MNTRLNNSLQPFAAPFLAVVILAGGACSGSTSLTAVDYALTSRSVSGATFSSNGWSVLLDDARMGFGPLYVCASVSASSELCGTAVAEFAAVGSVDLRATTPVDIGRMRGVSDTVHSALYDYGITWRAGSAPVAAAAAPEGHSLILRGAATSGPMRVAFEILIDVASLQAGSHVVAARVPEQALSNRIRLELAFDPSLWLAKVDFAALAALAQPVVITEADATGNAIATALTSEARPTFTWIEVP